MGIFKIKGDRKVDMEVSNTWIRKMRTTALLDQTGKETAGNKGIDEDCAEKHPFYIYDRGSQWIESVKWKPSKEESEEMRDRESYLLKIKEMILGCANAKSPRLVSDYREMGSWFDDKSTFAILGDP